MKQTDSSPLISIVMPAYNAEKYIKAAVDSVLNQSFSDFELIVADDGSTDDTGAIIKGYNDPRIKYLYQKNAGASKARNLGIINSRGKYVAFLDADDVWMPFKLMKQVYKFAQNPELGLVYGWVRSIYPDGRLKYVSRPNKEGWVYKDLLLNNFQHNGSIQMVKKECFETVGLFDETLPHCQDYDLWVRIAKKYQFGVINDILVEYRVLPNSLSKQHKKLQKNHFAIIERELCNADRSIKRIRNKIYSNYYDYLFKTCYSVTNDKTSAHKYLLMSLVYDPTIVLKNSALIYFIST